MFHDLALFPLSLTVFPGENLNLHIFEPRYKELILDCKSEGIHFGIPPYLKDKGMNIGTEVILVNIEKTHENGSMDIRTKGTRIFRIHDFLKDYKDKSYSGGRVEYLEVLYNGDPTLNKKIIMHLEELYQLFNLQKKAPVLDEHFNTYKIAHHVGFTIDQEIEFLQLINEFDRQSMVLEQLERFVPKARAAEELRAKIQMNGHFRNIIPPNFEG